MKVFWTRRAQRTLEAIRRYIAEDKPIAAAMMAQNIKLRAAMLSDFPFAGRTSGMKDVREFFLSGTPYLVVYQVSDDTVYILNVRHANQLK